MKLLKCKLCNGEVDIVGNYRAVSKKVKCKKCKFSNASEKEKFTEILIIKKPSINQ
jgi:hypothetical protein